MNFKNIGTLEKRIFKFLYGPKIFGKNHSTPSFLRTTSFGYFFAKIDISEVFRLQSRWMYCKCLVALVKLRAVLCILHKGELATFIQHNNGLNKIVNVLIWSVGVIILNAAEVKLVKFFV